MFAITSIQDAGLIGSQTGRMHVSMDIRPCRKGRSKITARGNILTETREKERGMSNEAPPRLYFHLIAQYTQIFQ